MSDIKFLSDDNEVIRINAKGFHYRGQFIADAGESHRLLVEFLREHQPEGSWQHAHAEPEPEGPTDEELESFLVDVAAEHGDIYWAEPLALARAVLARWGNHD